ncbi:phosphopyruvate hydratase [Patescibacteria group bacterium]|nr:phosphopyruvate hydratase [Patescibacteria group bacterium]MBU4274791.1 phosphopyruvate hydratase [Patescibacteria group bacterium]MBU4367793.1 phosphopyruvate hydratase [Patescibacteria group bacterium]MBU4461483.1 phosphopyruvate hydratase [Patescibacteria group bacterium]MCG2700385.1 phosphopyruvate hydratase [Candidatus Parcubacteria bacterium]
MKIRNIKPKEITDSRGNPTVEVEIETNKGKFSASVPSGASKGRYEALELRDDDGKGIKKAISNIKKIITPVLKNKEFISQKEVDEILIKLDGTENKSKLGVNAILPVSIAVCRSLAASEKLPLYAYIAKLAGLRNLLTLPLPCFNIINGGSHTENELDIQEFMVIPQKKYFRENLKIGSEIYQMLKNILVGQFDGKTVKMGDEGGFAPQFFKTEQALYILFSSMENHPDTKIGLDCAASHFYKEDGYHLDQQIFTRSRLLDFYKDIIDRFPIIFLEDPFSEDDWQGFEEIIKELSGKIDIIGDDLLATNIKRIKEAENKKACSGLILKPNQIGTVTETLEAAKLAKSYGWKILVSHRSGETCDDFIADLSVGVGADFIKSGAPVTPERMVKYNRLLEIEEEIHSKKQFNYV